MAELGAGLSAFAVGDPVIGFPPRSTRAELAVIARGNLVAKRPGLPWDVAPSLTGVATVLKTMASQPQRLGRAAGVDRGRDEARSVRFVP